MILASTLVLSMILGTLLPHPSQYHCPWVYMLMALSTSFWTQLLKQHVKVDFMDLMEWFLGIHFSWYFTKLEVDVHLIRLGYAESG
jgi:hypothetical protein